MFVKLKVSPVIKIFGNRYDKAYQIILLSKWIMELRRHSKEIQIFGSLLLEYHVDTGF